ncbi:hypothetical protein PFLG_01505 [Plasmodium falciparum RAJ116]|uniref:Uncharacterized protein n=1 Tax=Plasmodium falciparum RAJ116 TaxID=580058 RepID=A0A0L0CVF6_PLAFA|nr:hypothetical protein PFLG_01505 [Plasmodium falciparum RAJ116]
MITLITPKYKKKEETDETHDHRELKNIKNQLEDLKTKTQIPDEKNDNIKKSVDPYNDSKLPILNILDHPRKMPKRTKKIAENSWNQYGSF